MRKSADRLAFLDCILLKRDEYSDRKTRYEIRNAISSIDTEAILGFLCSEELIAERKDMQTEIDALSRKLAKECEKTEKWLDRELKVLNIRNVLLYTNEIEKINLCEQQELEHLRKLYEKALKPLLPSVYETSPNSFTTVTLQGMPYVLYKSCRYSVPREYAYAT